MRLALSNEYARAIELWAEATAVAAGFFVQDPRRAASLSNQGVACALSNDPTSAERHLEAALASWHAVSEDFANGPSHLPGRSSLHHFRLAQEHEKMLGQQVRKISLDLVHSGAAASHLALGIVKLASARNGWPDVELAQHRAQARRTRLSQAIIDHASTLRHQFKGSLAEYPGLVVLADGPDADPWWARPGQAMAASERNLRTAVSLTVTLGIALA